MTVKKKKKKEMSWSAFFKSIGNWVMAGIAGYEVGHQSMPDNVIVQLPEVPKMDMNDQHEVMNVYIVALVSVLIFVIIALAFAKTCRLLRSVERKNDMEMNTMRTRIPRPE